MAPIASLISARGPAPERSCSAEMNGIIALSILLFIALLFVLGLWRSSAQYSKCYTDERSRRRQADTSCKNLQKAREQEVKEYREKVAALDAGFADLKHNFRRVAQRNAQLERELNLARRGFASQAGPDVLDAGALTALADSRREQVEKRVEPADERSPLERNPFRNSADTSPEDLEDKFDIGSDDDTVSEASYSGDRGDIMPPHPLPVSPMVSAIGAESVADEMSLDSSSESSDKFHTPENGSDSDDEEDVKTAKN